MEAIKFYTLDEVKDKHIGEVGTPHRDKYEAELQSFLIGEAIKKARKSQNMTQEELAQKINVSKQTISQYETGKIENVPFDKILSISNVLNFPYKYFEQENSFKLHSITL